MQGGGKIDIAHAILMGIVQGLTEFLPVSSSGHLVLADQWFGAGEADLFFDTVLHIGTLIAVFIVLGKDVVKMIGAFFRSIASIKKPAGIATCYKEDPYFRLSILIIVGTIPAVIIGLSFQDTFEQLFSSVLAVGIALCVTGTMLLCTYFAPKGNRGAVKTGPLDAILIGIGQAMAITPGISRSGTTIAVALFLKIDRDLAGRFSFLLAIPAILGAALLQFEWPENWPPGYAGALLAGLVSSTLVGYGALRLLIGLVKSGKFFYFGFYCIPLGVAAIIISLL